MHMGFFSSAINILQTLVVAIGAGFGVWGVINLMEGYGNDNPGEKSQGIKQLMSGYNGSVVKTKIHDFYNELIWLISHLFLGRVLESSFSSHTYAKQHMVIALPDNSIQPVSDSQGQNDTFQSCKCGYIVQLQFSLP